MTTKKKPPSYTSTVEYGIKTFAFRSTKAGKGWRTYPKDNISREIMRRLISGKGTFETKTLREARERLKEIPHKLEMEQRVWWVEMQFCRTYGAAVNLANIEEVFLGNGLECEVEADEEGVKLQLAGISSEEAVKIAGLLVEMRS